MGRPRYTYFFDASGGCTRTDHWEGKAYRQAFDSAFKRKDWTAVEKLLQSKTKLLSPKEAAKQWKKFMGTLEKTSKKED